MTKDDLTQAIADGYRTSSRNFISDAEILRYLNRELTRLNGKVDLKTTIKTGTIAYTGDGAYTLSTESISDFKKPIALIDRTNNFHYKRVSKELLFDREDGAQKLYAVDTHDTQIFIEAGAASNTTLTLLYYSTHDSVDAVGATQQGLSASTDVPLLQETFHDFLVEQTLARMFRKERKYDDYRVAKTEASDLLQDIYDANPTQEDVIEEYMTSFVEIEPSYNNDF